MKLSTYVIGQGDTVELLASYLLGSGSQTGTLIQINNLRYPYISDDPSDQFANSKGTTSLIGSYTNPSVITIDNINSISIVPNDMILIVEGSNVGSGVVLSVNGSIITFVDVIVGSFDSAAKVTVFANQQNVTTQILRTGDTLLYPFSGNSSELSLVLGTDLATDENGFLIRLNNDIATVSGLDNLAQSIRRRFQTFFGSLNTHPDYGNKMFTVLGESSASYFAGLAKQYAIECATQDPRVRKVDVRSVSVNQDQIVFDLSFLPIGSQHPINQPIAVNIKGM